MSAILFWFIEGSWKTFQYVHYERSGDIEEYFRSEKKIDAPLLEFRWVVLGGDVAVL